ncbi:hypothetical protein GCM10011410_33320 [Hoyosella rhizosphaerae]|uniref:Carrier domain-containing protein n=2 Tax=Hoyosella rhizosphaerae TaxID=1755582 RepID=A0A916UMH1_9ACTN|nr:hypothetical protein GCM10011410_33320 [Hoyosella rhizosphaerae]
MHLPVHMVPSVVVVLGALPLTANGKLDRAALPEPGTGATTDYVAPETGTEQLVADVLARALGVDQVGRNDSFLRLGGNSLLAVRVVGMLTEAVAKPVELRTVLLSDSVAELAANIDSSSGEAADPLSVIYPIRPGGDGAPLFAIHPIVGLAWCYTGLGSLLPEGSPIYGVQSPAATTDDPRATKVESIDDLAAHYVNEIRKVQPEGPYRLLGWSLGGVIAHAVAVQLQEAGESVELLAMLDSFAGETGKDAEADEVTVADVLGGFGVATEIGEPSSNGIGSVAELIDAVDGQVPVSREAMLRLIAVAESSANAMRRYRPRQFNGDLLFFTATKGRDDVHLAAESWNEAVSGTISNIHIDATHWEMTSADALSRVANALGR